jgi:hypothetical protein
MSTLESVVIDLANSQERAIVLYECNLDDDGT